MSSDISKFQLPKIKSADITDPQYYRDLFNPVEEILKGGKTMRSANDERMRSYKRDQILEILKKNRDAHQEMYETALQGYQKALIEKLTSKLSAAEEGKDVSHEIDLEKPRSYKKEYDRAIRMFELQVDSEVSLSDQEFAQLVMDEWAWSDRTQRVFNFYSGNV